MNNHTRQRQGRDFRETATTGNDLKNAEMAVEGNYNSIDGVLGNAPARDMDLTDGQTYEEMRELAPETLPEEKQSLLEQLTQYREQAGETPVDGHEPPEL